MGSGASTAASHLDPYRDVLEKERAKASKTEDLDGKSLEELKSEVSRMRRTLQENNALVNQHNVLTTSNNVLTTSNNMLVKPKPDENRVLGGVVPGDESNKAAASTKKGIVLPDGAPTSLSAIVCLGKEDIYPSENAEEECAAMIAAVHFLDDPGSPKSSPTKWLELHSSVESFRRLLMHHRDLLTPETVHLMVPVLTNNVSSLRSSLSKNALHALTEAFQHLGSAWTFPFLPEILDVLVKKAAGNKKFLCRVAEEALGALVDGCDATEEYLQCLQGLCAFSGHKNRKIEGLAALYLEKLAKAFTVTRKEDARSCLSSVLLGGILQFLDGKLKETRKSGLRALQQLTSPLSLEDFEAGTRGLLPEKDVERLTKLVTKSRSGSFTVSALLAQ